MIFRQMNNQEIEYWYVTEFSDTFAENERKPLKDLFDLIDENRYEIWGLFDENIMPGYAALWKAKNVPIILLDYLGVNKKLRNKGIGANILGYLNGLEIPIVVESELPVKEASDFENSIRSRRIEFYKRNGFVPIYEMATCGMRWQALAVNSSELEIFDIMKWHRALYGNERTDVKIPIGKDEIPELPYWMKI